MDNNSRILIHWTGKDICISHDDLTDTKRTEYLERLKGIIDEGFWMMPNREQITGFGGCLNHSFQLCTCFTDLGVNNSSEHIQKYGLMGIGVSREFILIRDGRPVWYFLNDPTDIHGGTISKLFENIQKTMTNDADLTNLYFRMSMLFDYAKPMGENNTTIDEYYEEKEWRIVWNSHIKNDKFIETGIDKPKYKIPFIQKDLKVILLPDEITKKMLYSDSYFSNKLIKQGYTPSIITWHDFFNIMK